MLCVSFALFQVQGEYLVSAISKSLIVPLFTLLYFINVKDKSIYFTGFLVLFSISELSTVAQFYLDTTTALDTYYVIGNTIYILAYILLLIEVLKDLDFKKVFKNYKLSLSILAVLNVYIVYMLITIVYPVIDHSNLIYIELVYNIVMLLLLTFALINYSYNDNKKTLLLFVGCLCIVFSEFIQVAYFYISETDILNFTSTLLFVMAFFFFYIHARTRSVKTFKWITKS